MNKLYLSISVLYLTEPAKQKEMLKYHSNFYFSYKLNMLLKV